MTRTFPFADSTISYSDEGSGPIVVLVHGFGEDGRIFSPQVDHLKRFCRVIVPDLPGSGGSPYQAGVSDSIVRMADLVHELILSLTQEPVILLGHSMGGYITLSVAERYPECLKAFGLLHSSGFADSEEKKQTRKKAIAFIQNIGAYPFLETAIPGLFAPAYLQQHPDEVTALVDQGRSFSNEALIAYYEAMMQRPDRTHVLRSSKEPVLFILGTEDKAAPLEDVLKQVHLPDTSYFHVLQGVGHMGMMEATDAFNHHLEAFIRQQHDPRNDRPTAEEPEQP